MFSQSMEAMVNGVTGLPVVLNAAEELDLVIHHQLVLEELIVTLTWISKKLLKVTC